MIRFVARAAAALTLAAFASGCGFVQRQAFSPPVVTVTDARLGMGFQGGKIDVVLSIYNPNNFRLDAESFHYKLLVDSLVLGEGTVDQRVTIPKKDSVEVRAPVLFGIREVMLTWQKLGERGSIPFELVGDVKILTLFGSVKRGFSQRGTYDGVNISIMKK